MDTRPGGDPWAKTTRLFHAGDLEVGQGSAAAQVELEFKGTATRVTLAEIVHELAPDGSHRTVLAVDKNPPASRSTRLRRSEEDGAGIPMKYGASVPCSPGSAVPSTWPSRAFFDRGDGSGIARTTGTDQRCFEVRWPALSRTSGT